MAKNTISLDRPKKLTTSTRKKIKGNKHALVRREGGEVTTTIFPEELQEKFTAQDELLDKFVAAAKTTSGRSICPNCNSDTNCHCQFKRG